jgi:hypothetical protein
LFFRSKCSEIRISDYKQGRKGEKIDQTDTEMPHAALDALRRHHPRHWSPSRRLADEAPARKARCSRSSVAARCQACRRRHALRCHVRPHCLASPPSTTPLSTA